MVQSGSCLRTMLLGTFLLSFSHTSAASTCPTHISEWELRLAAEELAAGALSPAGLELFRCQAALHPEDWRAHGMLGQGLASMPDGKGALKSLRRAHALAPGVRDVAISLASELRKHNKPQEAIRMYHAALAIQPRDPGALMELGSLLDVANVPHAGDAAMCAGDAAMSRASCLADAKTVEAAVEGFVDDETSDETSDGVAAVFSAAITLAPTSGRAYTLLAERLVSEPTFSAASQTNATRRRRRERALKLAQKAVKLAPNAAASQNAVATALLAGGPPRDLSHGERKRTAKALRAAIRLDAAAADAGTPSSAPGHSAVVDAGEGLQRAQTGSVGKSAATGLAPALATAHYRLASVLIAPEGDDKEATTAEGTALMQEAVHHYREAARLQPHAYGEAASKLRGFEDALRQNLEAERRERLDRERMVDHLATDARVAREAKEEDAAFEVEYRERMLEEEARRSRTKRAKLKSEL